MKYEQIISEVRELYPNGYSDSQILRWIKEVNDAVSVYKGEEVRTDIKISDETDLIPPFDRMYIDFAMAQIAFHQRDDEAYARYIGMFNSRFTDWKNYFVRSTKMPKKQYENWYDEGTKTVTPLDN